jgi:uncharacterized DUF497 family protein
MAIIFKSIVFDETKNRKNIEKHQVSLATVELFEWKNTVTWCDNRFEYAEKRYCAIGYVCNRLFHLVFVDRNEHRRIIILRKANHREIKRYAKT